MIIYNKIKYCVYDDFRLIGETETFKDAIILSGVKMTQDSARMNASRNGGLFYKDNIYIFRLKDRESRVRWLASMVAKRAHTHPDLFAVERKLVEIVHSLLGREI